MPCFFVNHGWNAAALGFEIHMAMADDYEHARRLLPKFGCFEANQLTTPVLVAVCEANRGRVIVCYRNQVPSGQDRFLRSDGRLDFKAMEEEGYDVS